jgi:RES domain-containing protein
LSGDGAAIHGGRFNPKGVPALYLSLDVFAAIAEANQGFASKFLPCVLCSYDVDCEDIADLRTDEARQELHVEPAEMECAWFLDASKGRQPPSWRLANRLIDGGSAGALVPSFAPGAREANQNLVLWRWSDSLPHKVSVHDPSGRLPKDQLSWR